MMSERPRRARSGLTLRSQERRARRGIAISLLRLLPSTRKALPRALKVAWNASSRVAWQGQRQGWQREGRPRGCELVCDGRHSSADAAGRVAELTAEGMIGIDIVHGQVIVTLPDAVLVCTKQEFIEVLSAWRRAMASRRDPHASRGRVSVLARACEGNGNRLM